MRRAPNAYPITATHLHPDAQAAQGQGASRDAAIAFFKYALEKGQDQASKLDYVPLPADLVQQIESYIGARM